MSRETAPSFVLRRGGRFRIDRRKKPGRFAVNEIILDRFVRFLDAYFPPGGKGRILDAGAGTKPYEIVYRTHFAQSCTFDLPAAPSGRIVTDLLADSSMLPLRDESFDCILCTEVLEHVPDPSAVLREFVRLLKPAGRIFLTTPFLVPPHSMPRDFYRYTSSALRMLCGQAGLEVEKLESRGDYLWVLMNACMFPAAKIFGMLSRLVSVNLLHPANPLVYFSMILPQAVYVRYWKRANRENARGLLAKLYRHLEYMTPGYITVARKA